MKFTLETHKQNLKIVNIEWMKAMEREDDTMSRKWGKERNRILELITNWSTDDASND